MTHPAPGSAAFLHEIWRKRPLLVRRALPEDVRAALTFERFRSWCAASIPARVFVRTEGVARGLAQARILQHASDGLALYNHFSRRGSRLHCS